MAGKSLTRRKDKCPACGALSGCTCAVDAEFASLAAEYTQREQTAAQIQHLARLVALYYTTLVQNGVDEDAAMLLTQTWCELNVTVDTDDEDDEAEEGAESE